MHDRGVGSKRRTLCSMLAVAAIAARALGRTVAKEFPLRAGEVIR